MLETVRLRRMAISREVSYNKGMELPISKSQKDIIIGTLLGDGCLEFNGFHGSRLQIKQAERYEEYVFWLYENLKNLCKSGPKKRTDTNQWYFSTRHIDGLTDLYRIFYPTGKKIVPRNIRKLLISSISLAIWYMDDGNLDYRPKDHYAFGIATNSFSVKENYLLVDILKKSFGIEAKVHTPLCRGKRYPEIYIGVAGRD